MGSGASQPPQAPPPPDAAVPELAGSSLRSSDAESLPRELEQLPGQDLVVREFDDMSDLSWDDGSSVGSTRTRTWSENGATALLDASSARRDGSNSSVPRQVGKELAAVGELDPVWGPFAPPPPGVASHRHKTKLLLEWKEANLPTRWERFLAFAKELPLRAAAKPTPEFNLPVEGWGTNPDTVLAELEKRRGKLKYPKKRRGGSKPMFISMDDDDLKLVGEGPVLDWACLNLRQFLNSELKHLRGKTSLDLSHNPLTEIPIGLGNHHQLRHVTLHDCDLTDESIPRSFFTGLSQLQVLDISVNQEITEIGEEYGDLSGLRRLVAHNCRIYRVDNQIQRCPLEHLELQCNKLTSLPAGIIRLRALAYLDVEQNCMDFLPVFFGRGVRGCQNTRNLPSLRRLNLGVNHFSELPPGLPGLDRLESLWLHRSYLQKLPDDLGDMRGLKQLTAYGNGLREIPDSVSGLVSLETMALNDNTIGPDLPESMFGMTSLLSLDLCDNKIQALPTRLGELPNLRHLWLARNQIEVLPEGIGQLTTLESLHVHENKIKKLPSNLAGMKHLKSLTLARNVLDNLPPTFKGLTSLERLTMDHNVTIMELALQGMLFTGLVNLGAMTIDRFVFDQCDKSVKAWLNHNVGDLRVQRTAISKAKMKEALFGAKPAEKKEPPGNGT